MIAGSSYQAKACSGTITICASQWKKAVRDFERNCVPHDVVEWDIIPGC